MTGDAGAGDRGEIGSGPVAARSHWERRDLLLAGGLGLGALGLGALAGGAAAELEAPRGTGAGVVMLEGDGIDPTGRVPSTDRVQALLDAAEDGSFVVVPSGAVLSIGRSLTIRRRIVLGGQGELRFTAGITHAPAIHIEATGAEVRDLRMSNPNLLASATGDKSYGILIDAHDVVVRDVRLSSFQTGIAVSPFGEWRGARIIGNSVLDVLGAGGGPTSSSSVGEDRGDGIVVWGAEAVVASNRIRAMSGRDCRVGVHAENLGTYERTPGSHPDSMVVISGNVVTGSFRRGIAAEAMTAVSIVGNTVADATWWGIAVIFGSACSVTGNTVLWTRTASELDGSAFNPARAGLVLRGQSTGHVLSGNTVRVRGAADHAIHLQSQDGGADHAVVSGNSCTVEPGGVCGTGIRADEARRSQLQGNELGGFSGAGIACAGCADLVLSNNGCTGSGGGTGVQLSGAGASAQINGNRITDVDVGLSTDPGWVVTVNGNVFARVNAALVLDAAHGAVVTGNLFQGADARLAHLPRSSAQGSNVLVG